MADLNKIVEDLSSLTVLEAAELSKLLEDKWGVSAAAPVAVAAAPAAGGGEAAAEEKTEFDLDADDGTHIQGLQDAIWSASVQHGPATNVFKNAFKTLGVPDTKTISEVSDTDIISAFYDERSRTITQTDVDNFPSRYTSADIGKLIYFRNYLTTFPDRQASLENRYTSEKKDALSLTSIG